MEEDCDSTINSSKSSHYYRQRRSDCHGNGHAIRRVVLFDFLRIAYHPIPRRDDLTMEEALGVWYTVIEKHAMMEGALKVAADLKPEDVAARGLEYYTSAGYHRIQSNRDRSVAAVLKEQARQKQRDVRANNDELMSECYQRITRPCQLQATSQGKLDEVEAYPQWHTKLPPATNEEYEYLHHKCNGNIWTRVSQLGLSGLIAPSWTNGFG